MSIVSIKEIKNLQDKPNLIIFYFILSVIISFSLLIFMSGIKIDDFLTIENNYDVYITLILISSFITIVFYFLRLDLLICIPPYLILNKKLAKYKSVKLRECLDHLYLNNKRNILVSKILFSISLLLIILLVFLLRVENTIFSFVILPLFIIIDATLLIWSYFDYISFYTGVKLIFFMKLFHQDNKMLKEVNELKNYIKNNQWFEAKSEFLLFLRKNLKEIYYPISQKLRYHRIIEEFREFCVNIFDTHKSSGYNEKIELFFISLNRVLKYESKNLYEEDFVTPLLESLKYFSDLKRKINRWDKWIKHYVFNNEDFELLIDDQIIQEIEVLKNKLDINKFRNILKAEYSSEKEKDEIYRFYEIFIKEIKKIQSEYFSIFLSVLNLSDFKKLLGLIKNYTTSLENLFMKKLSKKECKKIYNNYKNLLDNIFETDKREILKENLKSLRKYKDDLDRLEIYIDFSKKYKILIFLDFSVINKQYYPIITLKLRTNRLFEFEVSEIFPIMRSEEIREDINQYLKKIAEKNKMKSNN